MDRQREIFLGQSSVLMRCQRHHNGVPTDVDIRMVVCFLGSHCNGVHKTHGVDEILQNDRSADGISCADPSGYRKQLFHDLIFSKQCHWNPPTVVPLELLSH